MEGVQLIHVLDYGAGNVRSLVNAVEFLGYKVILVKSANDLKDARRLIFPGVGAFGMAMNRLREMGLVDCLKAYIASGKPFFGICIGLQILFEESQESVGVKGLGIIPGRIEKFPQESVSVPQIGWNGISLATESPLMTGDELFYFVHSYCAIPNERNSEWISSLTTYGRSFISSLSKGNVFATQFHPEKSGKAGLDLLGNFLCGNRSNVSARITQNGIASTKFVKRIIACLDVRSNDDGDLVVTKGDQYDVRESSDAVKGVVRNLGKPVLLARRYYEEGADEIAFLNITAFRESPLEDAPMLQVLEEASKYIFVPLTIGGGIRDYIDSKGQSYTALDVAGRYFRAGADKISLGSDAVHAAIIYYENKQIASGSSSLELISEAYGRQAVVVSVDPKRVYVTNQDTTTHYTTELKDPSTFGPNGERFCWYQCTTKGGRQGSDLDVVQLAKAVEALGAGELLVNCIDRDGRKSGFEIELINQIRGAVSIPIIASSGAGCAEHFKNLFNETDVEAALAAGIFHRQEVPITEVKEGLASTGLPVRLNDGQ